MMAKHPLTWARVAGVLLLTMPAPTAAIAAAFEPPAASAAEGDEAVAGLAREVRDRGWIAFSAHSQRGDWDLFVCRPDGSSLRNISGMPEHHEIAPQFSRDGRRLLYRRLPRDEAVDGNHYGAQGELVLANSDGTAARALGKPGEYPWASWNPDGKQIACLDIKGAFFVDISGADTSPAGQARGAGRVPGDGEPAPGAYPVLRRLERKGFFQQLTWAPDGKWLSGVSNAFGTGWSVARMDANTGAANAVSRVDCCTPDWFPDSRHLIFSNRPPGQRGNQGQGWTQLWMSDAEGRTARLVYGEDGRHVYGGHVSPDGKYVLFTGNAHEDGDPGRAGAPMGLLRLNDAPIIGGESKELRAFHPHARRGPVLELPAGFEPSWTDRELFLVADDAAEAVPHEETGGLAAELRNRGWIGFSAPTGLGDWDLFVMRPDGSQRRQLTDTRQYNEVGVRFSPSGTKILYYRMPRDEPVDNNTYGTHELVVADADGGNALSLGDGFAWATWGSNDLHLARLRPQGIQIVAIAGGVVVRQLPRQGIVQHLTWSPDGQWFAGTANGLGPYWNIGCIPARAGTINAVSETDRYNCTPDWMPDSRQVVYSRGIIPEHGGCAELWLARGDGHQRQLVYAEEKWHIYGGCASPDGEYFVFTRSADDLGGVENTKTRLAVIRRVDTPMIRGRGSAPHAADGEARHGPMLDLGWGYEPHWVFAQK